MIGHGPEALAVELGSGYLFETPEPSEIDERGCFKQDAAADVERTVLELMRSQIADFEMPRLPSVQTEPNDRWRLASGLQKAVRFGLPEQAMSAVGGLYSTDRTYCLRRLATILVEDVMLGAPLLVAQTLAMLGQNEWRREVGERRLVTWISKCAAEAPKDRSAVELLVMVEQDLSVDLGVLQGMDDDTLRKLVLDRRHRLVDRMSAAQTLAGPQYAADRMPKGNTRSPTGLFQLMVDSEMSRWSLYTAAKTASRVRDAMFVGMPIIDSWRRTGQYSEVVDPREFEKPMIGDILAAAYDQYTRIGLRSLTRFSREATELRPFLDAVEPHKRKYAIGAGVFLGEGGTLCRRAAYSEEADQVHRWVRSPQRMYWMPESFAVDYIDVVRRNLGLLNEIRRELVLPGRSEPSAGAPVGLKRTLKR